MLQIEHNIDRQPRLDQGIEFEAVISALLAGFLSSDDHHLEAHIAQGVRQIMEFLNLDQGILIQWGDDPNRPFISHSWTATGRAPVLPDTAPPSLPWIHRRVRNGRAVTCSSPDDLPQQAEAELKFFKRASIQSLAALPLKQRGRVVGVLVFISQRAPILWESSRVRRLQLFAEIIAGALERSGRPRELEEQLENESLLAELSARFIDIPVADVDAAIEDVQRLICDRLGLDRSVLYQFCDDEPGALLLSHLHQPPDGPRWQKRPAPQPLGMSYWVQSNDTPLEYVRLDVKELFPWVYNEIRNGRTIIVSSLDDLPDEAAIDREAFRRYGTKSTVIVPLAVGGTCLGCLTFASMRTQKSWTQKQVRRFQFVARVFAFTLARRRTVQELVQSQERLQLATESADVGLWGINVVTQRVWSTAKTREVLGLTDDRALTVENFFALIHPDDRERVRGCVLRSLEMGEELLVEYRVPMVNAPPRWIVSRGRAHRNELGQIEYLTGVVVDISRRKQTEAELKLNLDEVKRLHEQLQQENLYLRNEVRSRHGAASMVGNSDVLMDAIRLAEQVASTDSTVLILGETGTGKELLAQYIHRSSRRCDNAFITTNIAAIPGTLLESELFGREKGAYTGALTREIGRFEMANGGTLFLDEIGEMPMETQAKLLRVLQSGEFERLGSGKTVRVDVRVITATNRNLTELIKTGKFREDLFYRLNVFPVTLPPLRNRPEDIPLLIWAFVKELSEKMGKAIEHIRKKDVDALRSYAWPGNVRELRNIVERSMILADGPELRLSFPDGQAGKIGRASRVLADVQRQHIQDVLQATQNRVYGSGGAAEILGIKPTTLYSLMARLGIQRKHG